MRKLLSVLMILAFLVGTVGCFTPGITIKGEEDQAFAEYKVAYIAASEYFEVNFEKYLNTYDVMPPVVQEKWKEELDPLWLKAASILDKWEGHVLSGTLIPTDMEDWKAIKDELLLKAMQEKARELQEKENK